MSDVAITVLDGAQLRAIDLSLPSSDVILTGAQVIDLADSRASSYLLGITLPESLRSCAHNRLGVNDAVAFRSSELAPDQASQKLKDYISAIADELADNPLVVSVLDGSTIRLFLEDEDDFAMIAENLFTDLDTEDRGKICKREIRSALAQMGVEMGVPPISEYPLLNDILRKHGAEGEDELGQAQFAQLLQPVLQELADALAAKHFGFIRNIKIINGSKLSKLLADEKLLNNVIEEIRRENHCTNDEIRDIEIIRSFLEKNGKDLGLPPAEANEAVILLYDAVFTDVINGRNSTAEADQFGKLLKKILEKFAKHLEANPVYHDLDS